MLAAILMLFNVFLIIRIFVYDFSLQFGFSIISFRVGYGKGEWTHKQTKLMILYCIIGQLVDCSKKYLLQVMLIWIGSSSNNNHLPANLERKVNQLDREDE